MADPTEHGIPRPVAIAWGMVEPPQRGPNRGMSHERIVEVAIGIADSDGLASVTMKRVAKSLGFTEMSLYRYVANKDELLLLMQDAANRLPKVSVWPPAQGWREGIRQWADQMRETYRRRPWLMELPRNQTTLIMPNSMDTVNRALVVMEPLHLELSQKVALLMNISEVVTAFVKLELELSGNERVVLDSEGLNMLTEAIGHDRFPALGPLLQAGEWVGAQNSGAASDVDYELAQGLEWIISGIERLNDATGP